MGMAVRSCLVTRFLGTLTFCAVLLSSATASAQAQSIVGRVTDESGAVLPGVTVTTTSPALQVPSVSAVTDTNGDYRLSPLPIGNAHGKTSRLNGYEPDKNKGRKAIKYGA